jgi:radical SAM superfamily enzyme YgiQ (UPF0313 family)
MIQRELPSIPIVIGNLLAIYAGEALLKEFPNAILCAGEGEAALSGIYDVAAETPGEALDRERLRSVPGLTFIARGELIKTAPRLVDLSELPPPRRDFAAQLVAAGGITQGCSTLSTESEMQQCLTI